MEKTEIELLSAEFTKTHEEFLSDLVEYLDPEERKEAAEDSIKKFNIFHSKILSGELTPDRVKMLMTKIKESGEELKYPRGICNGDCMNALLNAHVLLSVAGAVSNLPEGGKIAMTAMANKIVAEAFEKMVEIANGTEVHWKSKKAVHELSIAATVMLCQMAEAVKEGKVLLMKLPNPDDVTNKEKSKPFWN